jgi:hypothetical protein
MISKEVSLEHRRLDQIVALILLDPTDGQLLT